MGAGTAQPGDPGQSASKPDSAGGAASSKPEDGATSKGSASGKGTAGGADGTGSANGKGGANGERGVDGRGSANGKDGADGKGGGEGKGGGDGMDGTNGKGGADSGDGKGGKKGGLRRNPWVTVGSVVVVLAVLAGFGYFGGLGPMSRLNTARGIEPPAKLAGLDRITDPEIRSGLMLDQTREALSRINDGKQATVEAYGALDGKSMFVVIALRGRVDIDKTVKDSGATPEQIKTVGKSTCVAASDKLLTQCYRGSNTLTVIAQAANVGASVEEVGPVADEAFDAMK